MKRILITMCDMRSGGAQKSLVSFLNLLNEKYKDAFQIDVLVARPDGMFLQQINSSCNIVRIPKDFACMNNNPKSDIFKRSMCFRGGAGKIYRTLTYQYYKKKYNELSEPQILWMQWKKFISGFEGTYDIAISYIDGFPNYFTIDKVKATKKYLWVHNEYEKLEYNKEYDKPYFEKADMIFTISERCKESLVRSFPNLKNKFAILENISSPTLINQMADLFVPDEYAEDCKIVKLLSIGRLGKQKGFDLAVEAASILKQRGVNFVWYIIGVGPWEELLKTKINELELNEKFILLGGKTNPYPYIKNCDIFVQPSRFEGKSIVLDEAKILKKPIVVTKYTTVYDSIEHMKTGYIVDIDVNEIAEGIYNVVTNKDLQNALIDNLIEEKCGNEEEIEKYYEILI